MSFGICYSTCVCFPTNIIIQKCQIIVLVPVNEETVNTLRYRLNAMKGIMGDDDPKALAARKKAAKKRAGNFTNLPSR